MSSVDSLFYFEGAEGTTRLTQQEADEIESGDRSGNCSGTISGHGNRRTKSNTVVAALLRQHPQQEDRPMPEDDENEDEGHEDRFPESIEFLISSSFCVEE